MWMPISLGGRTLLSCFTALSVVVGAAVVDSLAVFLSHFIISVVSSRLVKRLRWTLASITPLSLSLASIVPRRIDSCAE